MMLFGFKSHPSRSIQSSKALVGGSLRFRVAAAGGAQVATTPGRSAVDALGDGGQHHLSSTFWSHLETVAGGRKLGGWGGGLWVSSGFLRGLQWFYIVF